MTGDLGSVMLSAAPRLGIWQQCRAHGHPRGVAHEPLLWNQCSALSARTLMPATSRWNPGSAPRAGSLSGLPGPRICHGENENITIPTAQVLRRASGSEYMLFPVCYDYWRYEFVQSRRKRLASTIIKESQVWGI